MSVNKLILGDKIKIQKRMENESKEKYFLEVVHLPENQDDKIVSLPMTQFKIDN